MIKNIKAHPLYELEIKHGIPISVSFEALCLFMGGSFDLALTTGSSELIEEICRIGCICAPIDLEQKNPDFYKLWTHALSEYRASRFFEVLGVSTQAR